VVLFSDDDVTLCPECVRQYPADRHDTDWPVLDERTSSTRNFRVIIEDGRHCLECGRYIPPGHEWHDDEGDLLCEWCYW